MRVLFTPYPSNAHLMPIVPMAWALQSAGHEVLITAHHSVVDTVAGYGLTPVSLGDTTGNEARIRDDAPTPRDPEIVLRYADLLGLPSPGLRATRVCRNKHLQRRYLPEHSPHSVLVDNAALCPSTSSGHVPTGSGPSTSSGRVTTGSGPSTGSGHVPTGSGHVTTGSGRVVDWSIFPAVVKPTGREASSGVQRIEDRAGLERYEVSNHARPGHECRHNLAYWDNRCWVGLGPGAETRVPMAFVVIGGVLMSTILTLFVVPCFYLVFSHLERKPKLQEEPVVV